MSSEYYISSYGNLVRLGLKDIIYNYNVAILERLTALSFAYADLHKKGDVVIAILVSNYHPEFLGASKEKILDAQLTVVDFQQAVASEYGYKDWGAVELCNVPMDALFEQSVEAITYGNIDQLQKNLTTRPSLSIQQSQFGHKATLLHYIAANGVELYRQSVAYNSGAIAQLLIDSGARKDAKMLVYGGAFTAIDLLLSSAHPQDAGLVEELSTILSY